METLRTILLQLLLLTLASAPSFAQQQRDSRGTDFWLAFLPNDRALSGSNPTLHIMITAETPANGTLAATRRDGTVNLISFAITQPNDVVTVTLAPSEYELIGANYASNAQGDNEKPSRMSVHITSDVDVSVYAETREVKSTDAWLVLPTDALGTDYRVLSYASIAYLNTTTQKVEQGLPSQFVVVATENDTRVIIDVAPGRTSASMLPQRVVTLHAGDVYLVQAAVSAAFPNDDLTGSHIRATKPVAVIGGHFRAQIPIVDVNQGTRDFLVEQVPSVETWGKHCVVVPPQSTDDEEFYGPWDHSLCRILASTNGTTANVNGTFYPLSAGSFVDVPLTETLLIDATAPILCAILARTSDRTLNSSKMGDPFLMVVPPQEQFQNSYTVVCVEPRPIDPYFKEHWLTLIVPLDAEADLVVDGAPTAALTPIPGTTLGYVHHSVLAGAHHASCSSPFGIYIYGYGLAESYGYTGGMSFERLFKPQVVLNVNSLHARPGKLDTIVVTIDSSSDIQSFESYGANRLAFDLTWNASMFVPRNSGGLQLSGVEGTVGVTYTFDALNKGDTVCVIAGYHALGTEQIDSIRLSKAEWHAPNGDTVNIVTSSNDGLILTDGICLDGGIRLFDPLASAHPLSFMDRQHYTITYSEKGQAFLVSLMNAAQTSTVVDIYNALGQLAQQCRVPANSIGPLPLTSAPYEPLFVHP